MRGGDNGTRLSASAHGKLVFFIFSHLRERAAWRHARHAPRVRCPFHLHHIEHKQKQAERKIQPVLYGGESVT